MRLLVLGGTTEANALAKQLAAVPDLMPTLSLAGRTRSPQVPAVRHRIGGFGGVDGLIDWLRADGTDLVIDATHPFAVRISANALVATHALRLPLISIVRPAWIAGPGDRWYTVPDAGAAAALLQTMLPDAPEPTALLTMGRLELAAFAEVTGWRLIVRSIEPPEMLPAGATLLLDRPPYTLTHEQALLQHHRITVLVTKNSGGTATRAKLDAARHAALPVIMIARPNKPAGMLVHSVEAALMAIEHCRHGRPPSERGV